MRVNPALPWCTPPPWQYWFRHKGVTASFINQSNRGSYALQPQEKLLNTVLASPRCIIFNEGKSRPGGWDHRLRSSPWQHWFQQRGVTASLITQRTLPSLVKKGLSNCHATTLHSTPFPPLCWKPWEPIPEHPWPPFGQSPAVQAQPVCRSPSTRRRKEEEATI